MVVSDMKKAELVIVAYYTYNMQKLGYNLKYIIKELINTYEEEW